MSGKLVNEKDVSPEIQQFLKMHEGCLFVKISDIIECCETLQPNEMLSALSSKPGWYAIFRNGYLKAVAKFEDSGNLPTEKLPKKVQ